MADDIAQERVWKDIGEGASVLVAAPGDPVPEDMDAVPAEPYREAIDLRADTADAALAKGEIPPGPAERERRRAEAVAEREADYAEPLPKPGEEGEGDAEAKAEKAARRSARKSRGSGDVEDKAVSKEG